MSTLFKNGFVVTSEGKTFKDVRVENGKITQIDKDINSAPTDNIIDLQGAMLLPGGIDSHTHFDMLAGEIRTSDTFAQGTKSALIGGTTTIIDFAEAEGNLPLQTGLEQWHSKADNNSFCDYGFHMTINHWEDSMTGQMKSMVEQGISSFKIYTAYSGMQIPDDAIYHVIKSAKGLGALVCVHCENGTILETIIKEKHAHSPENIANHPLTRPDIVEKEAVSRVTDIARLLDSKVYIVHLSSALSLETVLWQRQHGSKVLVETCPHYLLLDDSKYSLPGFESAKYVMSPPLRSIDNQEPLWNALANDQIQTVSTDHCSFNYKGQKERGIGDFTKIPNGIPSTEHRMSLMYTYGVAANKLTIEQFVKVTAENPAKIFGMYPQKGTIAVGSDADFVVFRESKDVISAATQTQHVDYTPYEGFKLDYVVSDVYLRGEHVVSDGKLIISEPTGKFLHRKTN